jgi:MoxR-like ATPase
MADANTLPIRNNCSHDLACKIAPVVARISCCGVPVRAALQLRANSLLRDVGNSFLSRPHSRITLPMSPETATAATHRAVQLEQTLRKVIRGKDEVIRLALVSIFARGHLLIEGVPGVGKTTLGQALARALDCSFQRIQFTSDMLPSDVLGISIYSAVEQQFEFKRGPVFTNILLADEINRTTPKTQSALLEAMNDGQVTIDVHSYPLPQPFLVLATQNPVEHHGTYPLPESQLDRFLMRVHMGYPDADAEREILRSAAGATQLDSLRPVLTGADVLEMQEAVSKVRVDDSLVTYALSIVRKTRESEFLSLGVSPRGSQMLYRAAQAMAFLEGRTYCTPEDFKPLVVPVFAHRVVVSASYSSTLKKSDQAEQVMREIVESVAVPV